MQLAHLNGLRALEAVLRLGSFRAAADELCVTPAAVGQQIRALEGYLGRTLFERHPRGAVPAAAVRDMAPQLTAAFGGLSAVLEALHPEDAPRRLSVTMTQALAETWMPAELPGLFARLGPVDLRFDTTYRTADLHDGSFDFAIRYGPAPAKSLDWVPLFPGLTLPVCTPDFARRYDLGPERRDLAGVPLCEVDDHTSDPDWCDWPKWCARFGVGFPHAGQVPHFSRFASGLRVAQAGLGLVIGGMIESFPSLRDGSLAMPFGPESVVRGAYLYRLVWVRERRLPRAHRLFRDWLIERSALYRADIAAFLGPRGPELVHVGAAG